MILFYLFGKIEPIKMSQFFSGEPEKKSPLRLALPKAVPPVGIGGAPYVPPWSAELLGERMHF